MFPITAMKCAGAVEFDFAGDPRSTAPIAAANPVHPHITRLHYVNRVRWNGRRPAPRPRRDRSVP
ncbi:hypothetical protein IFJ82_06230 [Novacetimonas hansenii]|uniref:hypothetical protein n=1 Tax=Novacetimonas hansenii TaxID=436 RepID=UPI0017872162|nr:hypothetical protein [Novacetimonas hansenii]QOF96173.1 hypothetical protein IFJ82_06230 [Novacetimonas hansenii]